jgi:hypothetical protein
VLHGATIPGDARVATAFGTDVPAAWRWRSPGFGLRGPRARPVTCGTGDTRAGPGGGKDGGVPGGERETSGGTLGLWGRVPPVVSPPDRG